MWQTSYKLLTLHGLQEISILNHSLYTDMNEVHDDLAWHQGITGPKAITEWKKTIKSTGHPLALWDRDDLMWSPEIMSLTMPAAYQTKMSVSSCWDSYVVTTYPRVCVSQPDSNSLSYHYQNNLISMEINLSTMSVKLVNYWYEGETPHLLCLMLCSSFWKDKRVSRISHLS